MANISEDVIIVTSRYVDGLNLGWGTYVLSGTFVVFFLLILLFDCKKANRNLREHILKHSFLKSYKNLTYLIKQRKKSQRIMLIDMITF